MRQRIKRVLKEPWRILISDRLGAVNHMVPDELYLKYKYKALTGKSLNLANPQGYNEKLQWLKLFNRKDIYTRMVDKYTAKQYVESVIGDDIIIPTLGVWNHFDEIDFNLLPQAFVLKCTHDSGGTILVKDKNTLNMSFARKKMENNLGKNYYWQEREWPYKNVKPRILAEAYMEDHTVSDLRDYKIHCFNGEPMFLQVIGNRNLLTHEGNQMFYTFDWTDAGWSFGDYPPYPFPLEKPAHLAQMFAIAKKLSEKMCYLRVDLYEINQKVYFGELTFYPLGGFYPYNDSYTPETDKMLGNLIDLSFIEK